jgi:hypothetical protein
MHDQHSREAGHRTRRIGGKKFSNDEIKVALSFSVEWPLESNEAGICLLQIFRGIRVAFLQISDHSPPPFFFDL